MLYSMICSMIRCGHGDISSSCHPAQWGTARARLKIFARLPRGLNFMLHPVALNRMLGKHQLLQLGSAEWHG